MNMEMFNWNTIHCIGEGIEDEELATVRGGHRFEEVLRLQVALLLIFCSLVRQVPR